MQWYDGLAILVFAIFVMIAWMVALVRRRPMDQWLAFSVAFAPIGFYLVARNGGPAEAAVAASLVGAPVVAAMMLIPRLRDVTANWKDGEF